MKKILLLIVSGLLIACMAGSAMASPASSTLINADTQEVVSNEDLYLAVDNPLRLQLSVVYTVAESDITYDYGAAVTPWPNSDGNVLGSASDVSVILPSPATFTLPKITEGTGTFTDPNIIFVTRTSSAPSDAVYKVTIGDEGFFLTSASTNLYVPEFPTIAAPIAGILGLLFIFGRKKEGL